MTTNIDDILGWLFNNGNISCQTYNTIQALFKKLQEENERLKSQKRVLQSCLEGWMKYPCVEECRKAYMNVINKMKELEEDEE